MDDRRDTLIELGGRAAVAAAMVAVAWYLFATTKGDADDGGERFAGLICVVIAAIVIARPLAALISQPIGGLFYPRRTIPPEPGYSLAEAHRRHGRYEQAILEYRRIAAQFPAEVYPYVAMIEIVLVDLQDRARADAIAKQGLATLHDAASRSHLLWMLGRFTARLRSAELSPAAGTGGDRTESGTETERS
ncbi:MAG TPA: hypothetical protein VMW17_20045 [Candidatus Binatia bacterium]|nr:hypothetical protein [Candidatus Binatia bacterium]